MATVAVFLALGGGAYAAITLPANSVGTRQLKNKAVTRGKLDPTLLRQLGAQKGGKGDKGDAGPKGAQGNQGNPGPNGATGPNGADTGTGLAAHITGLFTTNGCSDFGAPSGVSSAGTESSAEMITPNAPLVARDFVVRLLAPVNNNAQRRLTLRLNGADAAVTCTMSFTQSTCSSSATVPVPAASQIDLREDVPSAFSAIATDALVSLRLTTG